MSAVFALQPRSVDAIWPPLVSDAALADNFILLAEANGPTAVLRAENEIAVYHAGHESRFSKFVRAKRDAWFFGLEAD